MAGTDKSGTAVMGFECGLAQMYVVIAISQMSNSLPRTMRRKPSMRIGTSTRSNAKVFGVTVPSLRAWLLPWMRVTVFNLSSAIGGALLDVNCNPTMYAELGWCVERTAQ